MTDKFKRLSHRIFGAYTVVGLAGELSNKISCSETTFAFFHFLSDKTILSVKNVLVYYKGNSATPASSQTDYILTTDNQQSFTNPLTLSETADLLLDSKQSVFSLIRTQNNLDKSSFPDCFSETKEKVTSDIQSGKIVQTYLDLLPDEYKVPEKGTA